MPTRSRPHEIESAAFYGALDSTAFVDGAPVSAHLLRTLAMDVNALVNRGEPVLQLIFDANDGADTTDGVAYQAGFNNFGWTRVYWGPLTCPKKPNLNKLELSLTYKLPASTFAYLQMVTSARPFDPNPVLPDNERTFLLTGDSTWRTTRFTNIPCAKGAFETFDFFIKGAEEGAAVDFAVYGGRAGNTGVAGTQSRINLTNGNITFTDSGAGWNTVGTRVDDGTVFVHFTGTDGLLTAPRLITGVFDDTTLEFYPPLTVPEMELVDGSTYTLRHAQRWRFANIAIYTQSQVDAI